jgi:hypothetical protein
VVHAVCSACCDGGRVNQASLIVGWFWRGGEDDLDVWHADISA